MSHPAIDIPTSVFEPSNFYARLGPGDTIACCKDAIARTTEFLHQQFRAGAQAAELITLRARFIDQLLLELWRHLDLDASDNALVAVGGYGRAVLHPHSDIDILILLGDNTTGQQPALEQFLTLMWDIGLDVGHSVRTVAECGRQAAADITVLTNLMEARTICGPQALLQRVTELTSPAQMWPSSEFYNAKLQEQKIRHARFADTEYNLEPNVKSSPGGLRDLQVIGWIAERHFGVDSIEQIRDREFLNDEEMEILTRGRDFMWQVRYALHMITDREEDRLLFDHQRELARLWGYEDDGEQLAVEQFMQSYYRWALALGQLNEVLIHNFDQAILQAERPDDVYALNERFVVRNGYIDARSDSLFAARPQALLEVFELCVQHEDIRGVAAPTIRLIRNHRHLVDEAFRADPENCRAFMTILRGPVKMARQLRRMTRYGILGQYLPEFGQIVGQMQHDLFHAYTVDAHTLEVVKNCRRFLYPDFEEQFPVTCRVARRLDKPELLYGAALFHDIGKGRGGDHSELGAEDAQRFCQRHTLSEEDTELVTWLVRNHLVMSSVAQRKDIADPEVIQNFARHVTDERHLDYLFTLTVADINATNPTLWNAWRGSLLRQLYSETRRALRRGLENPVDKNVWIEQTRDAAADLLEGRGFARSELDELWRQRGDEYFLRECAEDIAWHTEAVAGHHRPDTPLVLVRDASGAQLAGTTQIFVHARLRAHLFSVICAELEQLDLNIHDARIYTGGDGMALDTFFVLDSEGNPIAHDRDRIQQIIDHLSTTLCGDTDRQPTIMSRRTPRQMQSFTTPTETNMVVDDVLHVSLLEVASPDRPGLLARIGKIFAEFNIDLQTAKIQTLGERVEDVFYITDQQQQPITDPELCEALQRAICDELDARISPT